ncbi:MAG: DUF881 domain-containing protein [Clostridium sp.]|uniref:DUF881 domain-containing protein n=1 Tax=Clostridium sp. TaxID=1506 RepID=UPI00290C87C7|nr:DUF881 domain-containing protein [Clostridium sp.]MDU5111826.1 DUF881 domain-containing protein [Clostridium sp.]
MKNLKGKIFILIASVFTGFLIINTIDMNNTSKDIASLNAVDYKKAVEERNKLYKEIEDIQNQNIEYANKINEYKGTDPEQKKKLIENMKSQLIDYGGLSGISDVKGPGLIIKIQDADIDKVLDTNFQMNMKLFHEDDFARTINEIRYAGAQAISINGHRVLPKTSVSCNWASIGFDDNSTTVGPFYIYAIGNPEEMKAYLLSDNSFIQNLLIRGIKVEIEEKEELIIPATKQFVEAKYMERYEVK